MGSFNLYVVTGKQERWGIGEDAISAIGNKTCQDEING